MDVRLHQVTQRLVHQAMALDLFQSRKSRRHDEQPEVAASVASPGVSGVAVALIHDFDQLGLKRSVESPADFLFAAARAHLGSTRRKGDTSTSS